MIKKICFLAEKKFRVLLLVTIAISLFLFLFLVSNKNIIPNVIISDEENGSNGKTTTDIDADRKQSTTDLDRKKLSDSMRLSYGIPMSVFENLPEMPLDFNKMVLLLHRNEYTNYDFFSEKYFLQPEFYPSFKEEGLSYWKNPDPSRYAVAGIGFFPGIQQLKVKKGSSAKTSIFVHSGFGVRTYQGVRINPQMADGCEGISVDMSENEFLLGPSYPKFDYSWAKKVTIRVEARGENKNDMCEIKFLISRPSKEKSENWRMAYGKKYFETAEAGTFTSPTIIVRVE